MRSLVVLIAAAACVSCSLKSHDIQKAPVEPNLAVVFDIDGTLTPKPSAVFTARPDAAAAVRAYFDQGYRIIYLSARIRPLQSGIPGWLKANTFPEGSIHVPQSSADAGDPAGFKREVLKQYAESGWKFVAAYGDSTTDFDAYACAGIPEEKMFALRRSNSCCCEAGAWGTCLTDWRDHTKIAQPVSNERGHPADRNECPADAEEKRLTCS